jgi:glycosyltransferase involved in cell wall biosynthesis
MKSRSILVEGWRFYGHSYSVVNEWQLLELAKRPGIELYFAEAPPVVPQWRRNLGLRNPDEIGILANLCGPRPGANIDITFRMVAPASFEAAQFGRTYVFCTADPGWFPRAFAKNHQSLAENLRNSNAALVTPTHWSKWGLMRAGADPARVYVVPHGVDTNVFDPGDAAEREAIRSRRDWCGRFIFLNVSAMTHNKGIDLLLKAFARVAVRRSEARLVLKGSDPVFDSKHWLNQWWREKLTPEERNACAGRVEYNGSVEPFSRLAGLFRGADAYVTPYRSEGFNLPALEAVASGLPLICTAGGPTDEFTTSDFAYRVASGYRREAWFEPEEVWLEPNLDELTQAMFDVLENRSFRELARSRGPEYVAAGWTWKLAVDRLLEAFTADERIPTSRA